jgi:hypothetical protein
MQVCHFFFFFATRYNSFVCFIQLFGTRNRRELSGINTQENGAFAVCDAVASWWRAMQIEGSWVRGSVRAAFLIFFSLFARFLYKISKIHINSTDRNFWKRIANSASTCKYQFRLQVSCQSETKTWKVITSVLERIFRSFWAQNA